MLLPLPRMLFLFISLTVLTSKKASLNFQSEVAGQPLPHHPVAVITDLLFVSPNEDRGFLSLIHRYILRA